MRGGLLLSTESCVAVSESSSRYGVGDLLMVAESMMGLEDETSKGVLIREVKCYFG